MKDKPIKEVSRPKEKGIIIKERSITQEEINVQASQVKGKGKAKVYVVDDLLMGEGESTEKDEAEVIMIAFNESDDYSQDGYFYQRLEELKQYIKGDQKKYIELLKTIFLSTRVLVNNTRKGY